MNSSALREYHRSLADHSREFAQFAWGAAAIFSAMVLIALFASIRSSLPVLAWDESTCVIEQALTIPDKPTARTRSTTIYRPAVRYRYEYGGHEYTGIRFARSDESWREAGSARMLAQQYPEGATVTCWINPKRPDEAVLHRSDVGMAWVGFGGVLFFAFATWQCIRSSRPSPLLPRVPASSSAWRWEGGSFVYLLVIVVGAIPAVLLLGVPLLHVLEMRSWVETPCTIVSREEVLFRHGGNLNPGPTYFVTYAYRTDDRDYRGSRYNVFHRQPPRADYRLFEPPATRTCFVNPADPTESVLDRAVPGSAFTVLLFPALMSGLGFVGLIDLRRRRKRAVAASAPRAGPAPWVPQGPVCLRSEQSWRGEFVGLIAVMIFVIPWGTEFRADRIPKGSDLAFAIFLGINIAALAGMIIHMVLTWFNPRARITLSSAAIPAGGRLDVQWKFDRCSARIRRLELLLEGTRPASRRTRRVFYSYELESTCDPSRIASGAVNAILSRAMLPSGADGDVQWRFRIRGEIPNYPDVDAFFPFVILPPSGAREAPIVHQG